MKFHPQKYKALSVLDIRCIPLFARKASVRRRRKIFCDKWYTTYINSVLDILPFNTFFYKLSENDIDFKIVYKIPYRRARAWPSARTKSIAITKLFKLLFNNFALDKHA